MTQSRLTLARDTGLLPPGLCVLGVPEGLSALDGLDAVFVTPSAADHARLGLTARRVAPDAAPATLVVLPRSKSQARGLVAQALMLTPAHVVIDGQKTDGIDSVIRDLRARPGIVMGEVMAKAHGKVVAISGDPDTLADWRLPVAPTPVAPGFVTRAGVFSADGPDPGSVLLGANLPPLVGEGADFGAGWGYLAAQVLAQPNVTRLHLVEDDATALDCAALNVTDPRATLHWADVTTWRPPRLLNFVVMNPPFHQGRNADPALGRAFILAAVGAMAPSGRLVLVANRHLPYEETLTERFAEVTEIAGDTRYKCLLANRPRKPAAPAARNPAVIRTRR
jgi:16S rRNA (guanine1207-N2)-methyltransferase